MDVRLISEAIIVARPCNLLTVGNGGFAEEYMRLFAEFSRGGRYKLFPQYFTECKGMCARANAITYS